MAASIQNLYDGLQLFRQYVEANMPFKATVYFGELAPDATGKPANLGAMYFRIDPTNSFVEDVFYKAGEDDTDWLKFGSGGSTSSINLTSGLEVERTLSSPFDLNLNLLNATGGIISISTPLILNFLNLEDTTLKNYFTEVTINSPVTLTLPNTQNLGIAPNTANQKIFVYVGINADTQEEIIAVKANSRIDANYVTTVYDFASSTNSNKVYSNLGNASTTGNYNLKLVAIMQVSFTTGTGWNQPTLILPYAPELDTISEKLLTYTGTGIANRKQLIDGDTLKDFQKSYNDLVEQTYSEQNYTKIIPISANYTLSESDFLQYQNIIFNADSDNLVVTIPAIAKARSLYISNESEFNLFVSYTISASTQNEILMTQDTKHLNFTGTANTTQPLIKSLDIKYVDAIPNYFSIDCQRQASSFVVYLNNPNGNLIDSTNFVQIELNKLFYTNTTSTDAIQKITFISSPTITIQDSASLGFSTGLEQQLHIYMYYQATNNLYGICVSAVDKLDLSKLYNVVALTSSSSAKGLYGASNVNSVGLTYVGSVNYNYSAKTFGGATIKKQDAQNELLLNINAVTPTNSYSLINTGDSIYTAFIKQNNNATYLKTFNERLRTIQNISKLNLVARSPTDSYGTFNLDLSSGTDVNNLPTRLGERYCIMDFVTPRTVAVLPYGGIFVADIITSDITLTYVGYTDTLVLEAGKKYLIWSASPTDFGSSATDARLRIISVYPVPSGGNTLFNFKSLNTSTGSYTAQSNDALLLGNTATQFTITLPDNVPPSSQVKLYFASVSTSYTQNYIIAHPSGEPFYQTLDATITVNNGGFVLTFEYNEINGTDKYWFVTSSDYNA